MAEEPAALAEELAAMPHGSTPVPGSDVLVHKGVCTTSMPATGSCMASSEVVPAAMGGKDGPKAMVEGALAVAGGAGSTVASAAMGVVEGADFPHVNPDDAIELN